MDETCELVDETTAKSLEERIHWQRGQCVFLPGFFPSVYSAVVSIYSCRSVRTDWAAPLGPDTSGACGSKQRPEP